MIRSNNKSRLLTRLSSITVLGCCAVTGCDGSDDLVEETSSALYGKLSPNSTYWNGAQQNGTGFGSPGVVEVCWGPNAMEGKYGLGGAIGNGFPGFNTVKNWWREAVENTWGRAANITFFGWGNKCTTRNGADNNNDDDGEKFVNRGKLMLNFCQTMASESAAQVSGRTLDQATIACVNGNGGGGFRQVWQDYAIHETGHALGFAHEQQRPDNFNSSGQPTTCFQGTNQGVDQNGMYLNDTGSGTWVDCAQIPGSVSSVMSYESNSNFELSPGDVIGAQKVYGRPPSGSVVGFGGKSVVIEGAVTTTARLISWTPVNQWNALWKPTSFQGLSASNGSTNRCWKVKNGTVSPSSPTQVETSDCTQASSKTFPTASMKWKAIGNLCVGARPTGPGGVGPGSQLATSLCRDTSARWTFTETGAGRTIRLSGTNLCVTSPTSTPSFGVLPDLQTCSTTTRQRWDFSFPDEIRKNGVCFAVFGGLPLRNANVGLWNGCGSGLAHEKFSMSGRLMSLNQCSVWSGNATVAGTPLQVKSCAAAPGPVTDNSSYPPFTPVDPQEWDIYW